MRSGDDQSALDEASAHGPQYRVPALDELDELETGALIRLPSRWRLRRMLALAGLMVQALLLTACVPWSLRSWGNLGRWTAGWLLLVFAPLLLLGAGMQLQARRPGALRRSMWRSGLLGLVALLLLDFGPLAGVVAGATVLALSALRWMRPAGAR